MYDVVIIGAGVSGAAVARELSRYRADVLVLEKEEDVCCGTSKANSAIVHAGYDAEPGSVMAAMNVRGNAMMGQLARDLDVPFSRIGSLVICRREEDLPALRALQARGEQNGVPDLQILTRDEVLAMEPHVTGEVVAALYAPTAGIVCPFTLNIALAENAAANGVAFQFDTEVQRIEPLDAAGRGGYVLHTSRGDMAARCVVNAAGVYADRFHNQVSAKKLHITPRRGDYLLLDKTAGGHVRHTIFTLPTKAGKGVLVTPTVHGNLLVGPTAIDTEDREGTNTTGAGLAQVVEKAGESVRDLPLRQVITSFAGLRAHEDGHEFILGEPADAPGFFDCAGIESPGLSSCPAIGVYLAGLLADKLQLAHKEHFTATRKGVLDPKTLDEAAYQQLIREQPAYGQVICRCETVTEGEILDAIRRPLGAKSLDGVKRRTRAGMGRCQAGFCSPRVMEILSRELGVPMADITKSGGHSRLIVGTNKDAF